MATWSLALEIVLSAKQETATKKALESRTRSKLNLVHHAKESYQSSLPQARNSYDAVWDSAFMCLLICLLAWFQSSYANWGLSNKGCASIKLRWRHASEYSAALCQLTTSTFGSKNQKEAKLKQASSLVSLRSSAILPLPPKGGEGQNGRASFKKNTLFFHGTSQSNPSWPLVCLCVFTSLHLSPACHSP